MKNLLEYPWLSNIITWMIPKLLLSPWLLACFAGVVFGIWPHTLEKSGLRGFNSPTAMTLVQAVILLMITVMWWMSPGTPNRLTLILYATGVIAIICLFAEWKWAKYANWNYLVISGILNGIGLIAMSRLLEITSDNRAGVITVVNVVSVGVMTTIFYCLHPESFKWRCLIPYPFAITAIVLFVKLR